LPEGWAGRQYRQDAIERVKLCRNHNLQYNLTLWANWSFDVEPIPVSDVADLSVRETIRELMENIRTLELI
jgi:hypothetical protein